MNRTKRNTVCLGVVTGLMAGCASTTGGSQAQRYESSNRVFYVDPRSDNPGGEVAFGCLQMLKAGPVGVPMALLCLPLAPGVAVASAISDAVPARVNDARPSNFAYPSAYAPGCSSGECDAVSTRGNYGGRGSSSVYPSSFFTSCYGMRC